MLITCYQYKTIGTFSQAHNELENLQAPQILCQDEYLKLKQSTDQKNFEYALNQASDEVLKYILFHSLLKSEYNFKDNISIKYAKNFNFNMIVRQEEVNFMNEFKKLSSNGIIHSQVDNNNELIS